MFTISREGPGQGGGCTQGPVRARCHLYLGIGHYLQSHGVETREANVKLDVSAIKHFQLAADLDPGDHLAQFYRGLTWQLSAGESRLTQLLVRPCSSSLTICPAQAVPACSGEMSR